MYLISNKDRADLMRLLHGIHSGSGIGRPNRIGERRRRAIILRRKLAEALFIESAKSIGKTDVRPTK